MNNFNIVVNTYSFMGLPHKTTSFLTGLNFPSIVKTFKKI